MIIVLCLITVVLVAVILAGIARLYRWTFWPGYRHKVPDKKKKEQPGRAALDIEKESEASPMCKQNRRPQQVKKFEFSKIILLALFTVDVSVTIFTCRMVIATGDTTALCYLIPSVSAATAIGINAYYAKAKVENRIKLAKTYGVDITEQSLSENF